MFRIFRPYFSATAAAALFAALAAFTVPAAGQGKLSGLPDFTELYDKQGPAVVSIDVTQRSKRSRGPELSEDDPFYEFFRRRQIPRPRARPSASSSSSRSARASSFRATDSSSPTRTSSTAPTRSSSSCPTSASTRRR
jgi:S1-C subfamily serine protease